MITFSLCCYQVFIILPCGLKMSQLQSTHLSSWHFSLSHKRFQRQANKIQNHADSLIHIKHKILKLLQCNLIMIKKQSGESNRLSQRLQFNLSVPLWWTLFQCFQTSKNSGLKLCSVLSSLEDIQGQLGCTVLSKDLHWNGRVGERLKIVKDDNQSFDVSHRFCHISSSSTDFWVT